MFNDSLEKWPEKWRAFTAISSKAGLLFPDGWKLESEKKSIQKMASDLSPYSVAVEIWTMTTNLLWNLFIEKFIVQLCWKKTFGYFY